jgi:hypothetical protein
MIFVLIACVHQFLWNMTHPYLLGALASFDLTGRVVVYGTAMQFLGVAVGPAVAAMVITDQSVDGVLLMSIGFLLASLACILPPAMKERKLKAQKDAAVGIEPVVAAPAGKNVV